jgi:predicted transposase YbfD/YdcC
VVTITNTTELVSTIEFSINCHDRIEDTASFMTRHCEDSSDCPPKSLSSRARSSDIEQRYYLVNLNGDVERFADSVRTHWGIENQVHWVFDVAFNEDACHIRKDHAPENFDLIRHIALNLLQQDICTKGGIKAKRLKAG